MLTKLVTIFFITYACKASAFTVVNIDTKKVVIDLPIPNPLVINQSNILSTSNQSLAAITVTTPSTSLTLLTTSVRLPTSMSFGSKPILKHQKLGFKNKAMLFMLKHKLLKFDKVNEDELRGARLGKQSLKLSIIGYVLLILSALITTAGFLGLAGLVLCIISVIKGIKALNHKKGDTNAIVGIVLSSLFLLLFLLVITLIARYF